MQFGKTTITGVFSEQKSQTKSVTAQGGGTIQDFEITKINLPNIEFRVLCSTGTYIRSLVHDFGQALGVGAYMSGLRRTKIGTFNVEDAIQWEALEKEINALLEG